MGMRDGRRFGRGGRTAYGGPSANSQIVGRRREMMTLHGDELDRLMMKTATIDRELDVVNARIANMHETKSTIQLRAVVDTQICTGCGICQDICPMTAISVDTVAKVDILKCTGCGLCTTECPRGAITLQEK